MFTAGELPNGSATVDYSWHLANGTMVAGAPITLASNSSQSAGTRESSKKTITGDVYVSWSADGHKGTSNHVTVTICG